MGCAGHVTGIPKERKSSDEAVDIVKDFRTSEHSIFRVTGGDWTRIWRLIKLIK